MNEFTENDENSIEGLLIDLDGVLYVGPEPVKGAKEAFSELREASIPMRFITNTTTKPLSALVEKLTGLGFDIPAEEILTAPVAARQYLRGKPDVVCKFLLNDPVLHDFQEFAVSDINANAVVIGDIGDAWNYDLLNNVFRLLMNGAELIALHRNKFWETENGLQMDIGAFVAALEYVSGKTATVIGKPSPAFFDVAVRELGVPREHVLMIGDDVDSDVGGAQENGIRGVLVKTGKYREDYFKASGITPDAVIDSFADVPSLLNL
jgi:HAD superfamily hydrolase (TIGR01458 family)